MCLALQACESEAHPSESDSLNRPSGVSPGPPSLVFLLWAFPSDRSGAAMADTLIHLVLLCSLPLALHRTRSITVSLHYCC